MDPLASTAKVGGYLALVLALICGVAYAIRRFYPGWVKRSDVPISVLARMPLGHKQEIAVVEIEGMRFVLGITATQITSLGRMRKGRDKEPEKGAG